METFVGEFTVGLIADPGLPEKIMHQLKSKLANELRHGTDDSEVWKVHTKREKLPLNSEGEIPFFSLTKRLKNENGWDYLFYLTDLPRAADGEPMLVEIDHEMRGALISLPVLGAVGVQAKARRLILALVHALRAEPLATAFHQLDGVGLGRTSYHPGEERDKPSYLTTSGRSGRFRLLVGMVRNNRPGRLLPALSSCIAAAAASGAFGIFYAAIWNMADALSPLRLFMISVLSIGALSAWLIMHNGLWSKTRRHSKWDINEARRDNASTIITVFLSVTMMYLVLYTILLGGSIAVISAGYLQSQLGHSVSFLDYATLSWLAASLGTIAGALGSNFDKDEAIREATYSRRQHERRKLAESYED